MPYIGMTHIVMAHIFVAYIVMADTFMAYIFIAEVVTLKRASACIVMAYEWPI